MSSIIPARFKSFFWDINFKTLSLKNAPVFILKRVLDRGQTKDILWLKNHYKNKDIKNLLLSTRDLSQKTATFWADVVGLNYSQVKCLQKPYSPIQWGLSS